MSQYKEFREYEIPKDTLVELVRETILDLDITIRGYEFNTFEVQAKRNALQKLGISFTFTPKLKIHIDGDNKRSKIAITGKIMGIGPLQGNTLKQFVNGFLFRLDARIEKYLKEKPRTEKTISSNVSSDEDELLSKLKRLKELLDAGVITKEEFEEKKKDLLDKI